MIRLPVKSRISVSDTYPGHLSGLLPNVPPPLGSTVSDTEYLNARRFTSTPLFMLPKERGKFYLTIIKDKDLKLEILTKNKFKMAEYKSL